MNYKMAQEIGLTLCIFGGSLLLWPPALLIWLLAIPGAMVWYVVARYCAWWLLNRSE